MPPEDQTQHSLKPSFPSSLRHPRTWVRWFAKATPGQAHSELASAKAPTEPPDAHAILHALTLLGNSSLPNGVVELVVEDFEAPTRHLFDIQDGRVTRVEPGKCVPWASIAGPVTAWALALGPARNTAGLQLTGDKQLARRVLHVVQTLNIQF